VVEISTSLNVLYITAYSVVRPDTFLLKLQGEQAKNIVRKMGKDFSMIASCL